jgi:hypothetical protein
MPIPVTDDMQASLGFVRSQTTHIESEIYQIQYPELNYAELVPVDFSAPDWIKTVTYYSMDGAGEAQFVAGQASDIPVVGTSMEDFETPVNMAAIGYDYGLEEVNQAQMLGIPLSSMKASFADRSYQQMCYDIAFFGNSAKGWQGLLNASGTVTPTVPDNEAGSSKLWADKTGDEIAEDVNLAITSIHSATNTIEMANTIIMPIERLQYIGSKRIGDTTMTVLEFIQRTNVYTMTTGQPLDIRGMRGMLTLGAGSTARLVGYRRSPQVLKMHIPMPHRFLPAQIQGLRFMVPGIFRLGGVDVRLPKAISYLDGI